MVKDFLFGSLQLTGVADIQAQYLNRDYLHLSLGSGCIFSNSFVWIFNITGVLVLIPLLNHTLLPFLQEYAPTMLKKIGMGSFILALSPLLLLVITSIGHANVSVNETVTFIDHGEMNATRCMFDDVVTSLPVSLWALVPPFLLVSAAEILVNVSSKLVAIKNTRFSR